MTFRRILLLRLTIYAIHILPETPFRFIFGGGGREGMRLQNVLIMYVFFGVYEGGGEIRDGSII